MSQIVVWTGFSGISQKGMLLPLGSDTPTTTQNATESTNDKGEFSMTVATNAVGEYKLNVQRQSDSKTLQRYRVRLTGAGTVNNAYEFTGESAAIAETVAATVDALLSSNHGTGSWGSEDTQLLLIDTEIESVIDEKTVILVEGQASFDETFVHCVAILYDISNGSAVALNSVDRWVSADRQLWLAQEPPFLPAVGDRVVVLSLRDPFFVGGRYVNR